jgi:FtsH-binding integral membrane protein
MRRRGAGLRPSVAKLKGWGGMAIEGTTVVLGIPIPSTDPVFLAIIGVHVLFGLAAVIFGAVAMVSKKGRGRHSDFGTIYFWCLFGVFVTMSALSFMRWSENYHLFILGALSFASALRLRHIWIIVVGHKITRLSRGGRGYKSSGLRCSTSASNSSAVCSKTSTALSIAHNFWSFAGD